MELCFLKVQKRNRNKAECFPLEKALWLKDGNRAKPQMGEGDRVLFSSYAGTEIDVDGQELLIMSEADILAIVN